MILSSAVNALTHRLKPPLLFIALVILVGLASTATATMVEIAVTPTNLANDEFVFSVSTNIGQGAVVFDVSVTNTQADIFSDSTASVALIHHKRFPDGGLTISGEMPKPAIPVSLEKQARIWKAKFTVPRELLKDPDLFFSFSVYEHGIINGKLEFMPSLTVYRMQLQDFSGLRMQKLAIEGALRIAKEFVEKKKIAVADSHIDSVCLRQEPYGDRREYWEVMWLRNIPIKGGQTSVYLYMDGTAQVFYGE
jgi:hypothetical protein